MIVGGSTVSKMTMTSDIQIPIKSVTVLSRCKDACIVCQSAYLFSIRFTFNKERRLEQNQKYCPYTETILYTDTCTVYLKVSLDISDH